MTLRNGTFAAWAAAALPSPQAWALANDEAIDCWACEEWNAEAAPFLLAPNTWYVGTRGLSAVLIDSGAGLVLVDAGLPQSAPRIATHIRQLGFDPADIRYIALSHEHFDHAGGVAALAALSGAEVLTSADGAKALKAGEVLPRDPQAGYAPDNGFPAVDHARGVDDGAVIRIGTLALTAIATPGHAPGGMSWQWQACQASGECETVLYADSLNAVSAPGYAYSADPPMLAALQRSIERLSEADCDILVAPHPDQVALFERQAGQRLRDGAACRRYAEAATERLRRKLSEEQTRD